MRRFHFRLQSVLQHRAILEERAEHAFADANARLQAAQDRLYALQQEFQKTLATRPDLARGTLFDAGALANRELFLRALRLSMEAQEREIEGAKIVAEEKRLALVVAKQAREAVTRLRETAVSEYEGESLRWQQDQLDEISSVRYWRATHRNAEEAN